MNKYLVKILCVALILPPSMATEDPFLDMLNNRGNNRSDILREFSTPPPDSTSPQPSNTNSEDDSENTAPAFGTNPPSPAISGIGSPTKIAMILPTNAGNLSGAVGLRFYEGCLSGLQAANQVIQIDLYETNGTATSSLAAYAEAISNDSSLIIGPLHKKNVKAVLKEYPQAPVPTLLLQPGRGDQYYVLTIDLGQEAVAFSRLLNNSGEKVLLVSDNSAISHRQASAFAAAWERNAAVLERFYVHDSEKDWQRLFDQLKEAAPEGEQEAVIFAAGDGKFIQNVRNFIPQRYAVYASGLLYTQEEATSQFLENLYVIEMPWFLDDIGQNWTRDPIIHNLPVLQQRFYALGIDACRIAGGAVSWFDGWRFDGVSGAIELKDGVFTRRGMLVRYQAGRLQPLSP